MLKPNPYVYPYIPFQDLSNKKIRQNFIDQKRISIDQLKNLVYGLPIPDVEIVGENVADKILSIFQDDNFRFGPKEYILQDKTFWIERLNNFIIRNLPIQFTILGFPFKIPVALKTNRILPDLGEVLSLVRLKHIVEHINKIYPPGSIITIFTEGIFGKFVGVLKDEWVSYREFLKKLITILEFDSFLKISDLSEMEKSIIDFEIQYQEIIFSLKQLYQKNDPEFMTKYKGTYESIFRIVSSKMYDEEILMDVYNENLSDQEISSEALRIREDIRTRAYEAVFQYHAYLLLRDKINYLEKVVPGALQLSVSPKPKRLGIIPINKECYLLPYHGVPVYYPEKDIFLVEYLIDIKRSHFNYTLVYFDEDQEHKPFYYIAKSFA